MAVLHMVSLFLCLILVSPVTHSSPVSSSRRTWQPIDRLIDSTRQRPPPHPHQQQQQVATHELDGNSLNEFTDRSDETRPFDQDHPLLLQALDQNSECKASSCFHPVLIHVLVAHTPDEPIEKLKLLSSLANHGLEGEANLISGNDMLSGRRTDDVSGKRPTDWHQQPAQHVIRRTTKSQALMTSIQEPDSRVKNVSYILLLL